MRRRLPIGQPLAAWMESPRRKDHATVSAANRPASGSLDGISSRSAERSALAAAQGSVPGGALAAAQGSYPGLRSLGFVLPLSVTSEPELARALRRPEPEVRPVDGSADAPWGPWSKTGVLCRRCRAEDRKVTPITHICLDCILDNKAGAAYLPVRLTDTCELLDRIFAWLAAEDWRKAAAAGIVALNRDRVYAWEYAKKFGIARDRNTRLLWKLRDANKIVEPFVSLKKSSRAPAALARSSRSNCKFRR